MVDKLIYCEYIGVYNCTKINNTEIQRERKSLTGTRVRVRPILISQQHSRGTRMMAGTPLPSLQETNKQWSQRKQAVWISWMIENDATPGQAFRKQRGQPKKDIVCERTLRRWLNHFKWWGEDY